MGENIRFAFQGIWSHKMRSFLTMLGVIIGIASIIAIVSTIKGTNDQIMRNLIGSGNNAVTVTLHQGEDYYYSDVPPSGVTPVTDEQMEEIRALPDVEDASFYLTRSWVDGIASGENALQGGSARGIDSHYLNTCGYVVSSGRNFIERDYEEFRKVLLIDETAQTILFDGASGVGRTVEIRGEPFTVVGIIKKADEFKPVINSIQDYMTYHQEEYGTVYMPDSCWPILFSYDEPQSCVARAVRTEDMSSVGREVSDIMNRSVNSTDESVSYKAEDLLERARNQQELSQSTNNMLIWIASIALLVGGIGVMNIMLVSVTERTSEIGLKKALGARKRRILAQFLTESAVLTSIGGILGVISGLILAKVISVMTGTPSAVSIPAIILGVAFSMFIGIVFGLLPSIKAANMDPIEALRHE